MDDLCRIKLLTECRPAVVARGKDGGSVRVKVKDVANDQAGDKRQGVWEVKRYSVR
jgi:hypothetical protein